MHLRLLGNAFSANEFERALKQKGYVYDLFLCLASSYKTSFPRITATQEAGQGSALRNERMNE